MHTTWISLSIFLMLLSARLSAQQCGWEGLNAFVLDVHTQASREKIKGLKIYLVGEDDKPYFWETRLPPTRREMTWHTEYEPMVFWDNAARRLKMKNSFPPRDVRCVGAEDHYMILINDASANPPPVYKALIVDIDGPENGGWLQSILVPLDFGRSVNLCQTGFVGHKPDSTSHHSRLCEDGLPYAPIEIVIDGQGVQRVSPPLPPLPDIQQPAPEKKPQKPRKTTDCLEWIGDSVSHLPVIYPRQEKETWRAVRNDFRFVNGCRETLRNMRFNNQSYKNYLSTKVPPGDTGIVTFIENYTFNLPLPEFIDHRFGWESSDSSTHYIRVTLVNLGKPQQMEPHPDGRPARAWYAFETDSLRYELVVDEDGFQRSYGLLHRRTGERYGNWRFWDEQREEGFTRYSKLLRLGVHQANSPGYTRARVQVRKGGKWTVPFYWETPQGAALFVEDGTDSVRVLADGASNAFPVDYFALPDEVHHEIWLIADGGDYLRSGAFNLPFKLMPGQYAVVWDWAWMQRQSGGSAPPSEDELRMELLQQFPDIVPLGNAAYGDPLVLDISRLSGPRQEEILQALLREPRIARVSQVIFSPGVVQGYANGLISLRLSPYLKQERILAICNQNGFNYLGPVPMSGGLYNLLYEPKLIDGEFYRRYNRFFEDVDVWKGWVEF